MVKYLIELAILETAYLTYFTYLHFFVSLILDDKVGVFSGAIFFLASLDKLEHVMLEVKTRVSTTVLVLHVLLARKMKIV